MSTLRVLLFSTVGLMLVPTGAHAENAGASEDIVVTARKREEKLQDVPLAITAFSAEQMLKHQVRSVSDIAALTPGLNFESYLGGSGTPVIRGASQQRITDLDQNVSTFFDGIFMPRQYAINPGVITLDRVEVVKGPQSALYGRDAFSGAINYVAKKPTKEWTGSAELTGGLYKRFDGIVDISGPIIKDKLLIKLGFGYSTFDGDVVNSNPNAGVDISPGSPGRLGGWHNRSYQGRLVYMPTDNLTFDVGAYQFDIFQETPAVIQLKRSSGDTNCGAIIGGKPAAYCGELPWQFKPLAGSTAVAGVNVDPRGYGLKAHSTIVVGKIDWKASSDLSLAYEYGYLKSDAVSGGSSDRDPVQGTFNPFNPPVLGNQFQVSPVGDVIYYSHELRADYHPTPAFNILFGGIYSKVDDFDTFPLNFGLALLDTKPYDINGAGWLRLTNARTLVDTKAIFGRVGWQITDKLRFGTEARYQWENKDVTNLVTSFSAVVTHFTGDWKQFTPRFTLDYKVTDKNLIYATVAKGAKAGGINGSAIIEAQRYYDPDTNWTYEIGSKNDLFDGKVRINVSAYYIDWSNRQVSCSASGFTGASVPPALICNVGKANVKGFEADTNFTLAKDLNLHAAFSYNDAKYATGVVDQRLRDYGTCDGIVCRAGGVVGGNQLERQSKVQASIGMDYSAPISSSLTAFGGFDANYKSKQFSDSANLAYLPSRWLVDARIGVRGDKWSVTAWAKNLFNLQYAAAAFATFAATDTVYVPTKGASRTLGLTANHRF